MCKKAGRLPELGGRPAFFNFCVECFLRLRLNKVHFYGKGFWVQVFSVIKIFSVVINDIRNQKTKKS